MYSQINFAVEELFTNFVKHNPVSEADILLQLEQKGRAIKLEIIVRMPSRSM